MVVCKMTNPRRKTRAVRRGGPSPRKRLLSLRTVPGLVGRDRYILRRIGPHPYLYLRQYQGAVEHAKPRYSDLYLGPVPERLLLTARLDDLHAWASQRRRALVRRLSRP